MSKKKFIVCFLGLLALFGFFRVFLQQVSTSANANDREEIERKWRAHIHSLQLQEGKQITSGSRISAGDSSTSTSSVGELARRCIASTHLDTVLNSSLQSVNNAIELYEDLRKVIPRRSLPNHASHCWKAPYFSQWKVRGSHCSGHIGNWSFAKTLKYPRSLTLQYLSKIFHTMQYKSELVCMPNVFLAGFPKSGSTFLYCFINELVSLHSSGVVSKRRVNVEKEPHYWVLANAARVEYKPSIDDLGSYLLNFIPGLQAINEFKGHTAGILMDGSPNIMFNWPRHKKTEHDLTNYCLMPSVLPEVLPNAKFMVIMRNPVHSLYSSFWFSCTSMGVQLSNETALLGPQLFHNRIMHKINMFLDCMRDTAVPSMSHVCELGNAPDFDSCIRERLHLLEKCSHEVTFNLYSPEMPRCGRTRVAMVMYYVHLHKWLSVVPKKRFLFLTLEELVQDYASTAQNVVDFLGLRSEILSTPHILNSCHKNSQYYKHEMRPDTKRILEQFYAPLNSLLAELVGSTKFLWKN